MDIPAGNKHNPEDFLMKAVRNLELKLDQIIYYGLLKGALQPPKCPTNGKKWSMPTC